MSTQNVSGILFDKDGTLIDFRDTWDGWAASIIFEATGANQVAARKLANTMRYDLDQKCFLPESPIIAGTAWEAAQLVAEGLARSDVAAVEEWIASRAAEAQMVPVVPLLPLCSRFKAAGISLGVATNDAEAVAHSNLETLGLRTTFDYVAGFDSGYGGKPEPGMVTGFCTTLGIDPAECLMVGDSPHDLLAARAAGVRPVAVLTGIATEPELAPLSEVVLPDIGYLPDWLGLP